MDCFAQSVWIVSAYIAEGHEFLMNLPGAAAAGLRKAFRATIAPNSMGWVTFRWKTSFRQMIFFVYATKYSPTKRPLGTWFRAIPSRVGLPLMQLMTRLRSEERRVGKECVSTCKTR